MKARSNRSYSCPGSFPFSEESEILEYYREGRVRSGEHDKDTIRALKDSGYLRCGITDKLRETLKTTKDGTEYLKWLSKRTKRSG